MREPQNEPLYLDPEREELGWRESWACWGMGPEEAPGSRADPGSLRSRQVRLSKGDLGLTSKAFLAHESTLMR